MQFSNKEKTMNNGNFINIWKMEAIRLASEEFDINLTMFKTNKF